MSSLNIPEDQISSERVQKTSETLLDYFTKTGILSPKAVKDPEIEKARKLAAKRRYHNTQMLLSKYRIVLWALECVPGDIGEELRLPTRNLDALIERVDLELAMDNKRIEYQIRGAAKTKMLIERVQDALWMLKKYPDNGERLYDLIYMTYVDPIQRSMQEILDALMVSERTYYRLKTMAIDIMSIRLWAAPTGETDMWLEILTLIESL